VDQACSAKGLGTLAIYVVLPVVLNTRQIGMLAIMLYTQEIWAQVSLGLSDSRYACHLTLFMRE